MPTIQEAKQIAYKLSEVDNVLAKEAVRVLLDLIDKLDYLEERDTISDSKLQLFRDVGDTWKEAAMNYQLDLEATLAINEELRKQVSLLKAALLDS
jgi:hypothetical protein